MLLDPAALERKNLQAEPTGAPETPLYLDDLLPAHRARLPRWPISRPITRLIEITWRSGPGRTR